VVVPDGTYQLKDSAANNIGSPGAIASGASANITAPDATVKTTDGVTTVQAIRSNANGNLPQSVIKYKDAANASQVTAAANTEFASGTLRPATEVPRRELKYSNGTGLGTFASADKLIADTMPTCPIAAADTLVEITASGTYTPPANLKEVVVFAFAGAGGGGGGRSTSTANVATGGGAGGAGAYVIQTISAGSLGGPVTVTIGAGGSGGAGATNGTGSDGGNGGDTSFGAFVIAKGGVGGQGGQTTTTTPTNTALALNCTPLGSPWARNGTGGTGCSSSGTSMSGAVGSAGGSVGAQGGRGGWRSLAAAATNGGDGGGIYQAQALVAGGAGASTAGAAGTNGADNVKLDYLALHTTLTPTIGPGTGGGGGAYGSASAGGAGGTSGKNAGGAGGGAAINTQTSGAGSAGGAGFVVVLERYNAV
jgi:hypothetical protein